MAERGHTEKYFVVNIVVRWPSEDTLKSISWKSEEVLGYLDTDEICRLD